MDFFRKVLKIFLKNYIFIKREKIMIQRYKKLSEYAKENSVVYRTAWNRFKEGKIKGAFQDGSGNILVPIFLTKEHKEAALYARVSNSGRKSDLESQMDRITNFAISNGYKINYAEKEIASGMNDARPRLEKLLLKDDWDVLIVEHKDRLTRFGFNYLKLLLNKNGKDILVINEAEDNKEDILKDMISIIYSFSARLYGLRRKKSKKEIITFLEN